MSKKSSFIINLALVLISVTLVFVVFEIIIRNTSITDKLGWTRVAPIKDRLESAETRKTNHIRVLGLGDSFSEYRDSDGKNYLRVMEKLAKQRDLPVDMVNLSELGTGILNHRHKFKLYADDLQPEIVTIGIYLGNDIVCPGNFGVTYPELSENTVGFKNFIKRNSVLVNYLFRQTKYYFPSFRSGLFERYLSAIKKRTDISPATVDRRLQRIDKNIVERSKSDLINPKFLATALMYPEYYSDLYSLASVRVYDKVACFLRYIDDFAVEIKERNIEPIFILIPDSVVISKKYHDLYRRSGFIVDSALADASVPLVDSISSFLSEGNYRYVNLLPTFRRQDAYLYIPADIHLNQIGQHVAGEALLEILLSLIQQTNN